MFRGRGDDGRLGHGDTGWKYVPKITQALHGQMVVQVTCGSYHTAAVTETGELWTWGGGMYGKLGHGNERGESSPKRVEALANIPVSQIACGSRHTAVVTTRGDVYTWYVCANFHLSFCCNFWTCSYLSRFQQGRQGKRRRWSRRHGRSPIFTAFVASFIG